MKNGLYSAKFGTAMDGGSGVIVATDGRFLGGDDNFYYAGNYKLDGETVTAELNVKRHAPGGQSVFGTDDITIGLAGTSANNAARLSGSKMGINFSVDLNFLCV